MCDDDSTKYGGCCCCCVVITVIILVASSISSLPVNTWGLVYNGIGKTVDYNVYSSGIHTLGPMRSFIEYPTTLQTMSFRRGGTGEAISARSKDGLIVTFNAEFQYQLQRDKLFSQYMKFGVDYKSPCSRYAIDILNDSAAKENASSFFKELNSIS